MFTDFKHYESFKFFIVSAIGNRTVFRIMRKYLHFVSLILLCCVNADINSESIQDNPIVRLRLGTIRGNTMTTRLGKTIYAFRGIPYAKPPVGLLRFKVKQFTFILDCIIFALALTALFLSLSSRSHQ